jgi:hypothetical protein
MKKYCCLTNTSMKRKLNVADLNDGIDGEVDQENFNPWTNQQYSTRYYILLQ